MIMHSGPGQQLSQQLLNSCADGYLCARQQLGAARKGRTTHARCHRRADRPACASLPVVVVWVVVHSLRIEVQLFSLKGTAKSVNKASLIGSRITYTCL